MPIERIAKELGEDISKIKRRIRLLSLPPTIQTLISRYYMKTAQGLKLSPAIGEELVAIKQRLIEQKVDNVDLELLKLAIKCAKETLRLSDVRAIHKEIAWKRFENYKNKGVEQEQRDFRCYLCGEKILPEDNPWLPLCAEHKTLLTTYKDEITKSLPKQAPPTL